VSQAASGRQRIGLGEDDVRLPRQLQLLSVEPEVLDLEFRSVASREVPIQAQLIGSPPEGLQVASVRVTPPAVSVLLPEGGDEGKGAAIMTSPIYLPGLKEDTTVMAKVIGPPGVLPPDKRWPDVEVRITFARPGGNGRP